MRNPLVSAHARRRGPGRWFTSWQSRQHLVRPDQTRALDNLLERSGPSLARFGPGGRRDRTKTLHALPVQVRDELGSRHGLRKRIDPKTDSANEVVSSESMAIETNPGLSGWPP